MPFPSPDQQTILFLTANPKKTQTLRLDNELRDIAEGLQRAQKRDQFKLEQRLAVRPRDIQRAMLDVSPQIIHFSGHGTGEQGLVFEDEQGNAKLVDGPALAALFALFAEQLQISCVVLNGCYSAVQASAIAQHIPYVIGMNQAIGDKAAITFAVGFYDALGAGRPIEFAYKLGCNAIQMEGIAEHLTPVLLQSATTGAPSVPPNPDSAASAQTGAAEGRDLGDPPLSFPASVTPLATPAPVTLEEAGGQVPLDSPFYVDRPPIETRCYEAIVKPGALIRIKAPRQMGKSSLTIRIFDQAEQRGYRSVWLQLQQAGEAPFASLDTFLQWLCRRVTVKLRLEDRVADYWQSVSASTDKCTDYFERYLLETINAPLALCLDEVDEIFKHPALASDFFGLLRSWHEEAKITPIWRHLRLVITHSEEVYIPLNINQSPFNVGVPIELPPLNRAQVSDLVQRHGLVWTEAELDALLGLVGGQPYLTRVALQQIASGETTLAALLPLAPTQAGPFASHLRQQLGNLQERQLATAMKLVVTAKQPVSLAVPEASKLANMGLIRFQGNASAPLCDLYRQYFKAVLS